MNISRAWSVAGWVSVLLVACDNGEELKLQQARADASAKSAADEREANQRAEAAREQRNRDAKAEPARAEARAAIRKTLSASDMKAMDLKERLAKLPGKRKDAGAASSAAYDKTRTAAERDLEGLNTSTGAAWDSLKAHTDQDLEALKGALAAFEKAVGH